MRRVTSTILLSALVLALAAGCGKKGGDGVTGPGDDTPLRLGLVTADVNGQAWSSVDAAQSPIAECYLFILASGDSVLQVTAWRRPGNDTLASGIFINLPSPRPGSIALEDVSTAAWYVHRVAGTDTLETWWSTAGQGSGTLRLGLDLAADSVYATFDFFGFAPDTVRVTNGRLALAFNVVREGADLAANQARRPRIERSTGAARAR